MATIDVKDAAGSTVAIEKPLAAGTAADSASRPVAWSTEGKAQIGALTETAPATDTASSGLNGRLQRVAQRLTTMLTGIVLAAGENHIGGAHGWGFDVAVTPTVTNGAYSANDIMGALLTFANCARINDEKVVITGVQVVCKAAVLPNLTLVLLNADPTSTTKTDNAAYSLNAADAFKVVGAVSLGTAWMDHGTPNSVRQDGLSIVAAPVSGGRDLYGLLIDGTGVTLTSTGDIQVRLRGVGI